MFVRQEFALIYLSFDCLPDIPDENVFLVKKEQ